MRQGIFATAALVAGILTTPAQATVFPADGATGDVHGQMRCPRGYVLVGFVGRTGDWIDKIGLKCAQILPGYVTGGFKFPPGKGGDGGEPESRYCPRDAAVRGITVHRWSASYVSGVDFSCVQPKNGLSKGNARFGPSNFTEHWDNADKRFDCPDQEYATGITLHYGRHVNAVGLICGVVEIK